MRTIDANPCQVHILVCANARPPGGLPSCQSRGEPLFDALKAWTLQQRRARTVWVTQTRCLGFCHADGATLAFYYPQSPAKPVFVQAVLPADLPALLQRYVLPALT